MTTTVLYGNCVDEERNTQRLFFSSYLYYYMYHYHHKACFNPGEELEEDKEERYFTIL